jgi:hypothetical protein
MSNNILKPSSARQRRPWVSPELSRLVAGRAELIVATTFDNTNQS